MGSLGFEYFKISTRASLKWDDLIQDGDGLRVDTEPSTNEAFYHLRELDESFRIHLQFRFPKSDAFYRDLIQLTKGFNKVYIQPFDMRPYNMDAARDMSHDIKQLGTIPGLQGLSVYIQSQSEMDALAGYSDLKSLSLSIPDKFKPKPDVLANLKHLQKLTITGTCSQMNFVNALPCLKMLELKYNHGSDVDYLYGNRSLDYLFIDQGRVLNIDAVDSTCIRFLHLLYLRRLSTLPSKLSGIKELRLRMLTKLEALPDFTGYPCLEVLEIEGIRKCKDLSQVLNANHLKYLIVIEAQHMKLEDFEVLKKHPSLLEVRIGTGSFRRNNAIKKMLPFPSSTEIPPLHPDLLALQMI